MTNRLALILGAILLVALITDMVFFGMEHLIFLSKKLMELIEWVAFWR